jgi:TrkA domain protein
MDSARTIVAMAEVTETRLPGVGVRHEFTTTRGEHIGVLALRSGWHEVVRYDRADPDASATLLRLSPDDSRTLVEMLGGSRVSEAVSVVQQQVEGLAIDWLTVTPESQAVGSTIGEGQFRSRTGASIVAVVRGDTTVPAPGPEFRFEPGDVAVAVGTRDGLAQLRDLLRR